MKTAFILIAALVCSQMARGSGWSDFQWFTDLVAKNIQFLDEGRFPKDPGVGYPWLTVMYSDQKAVLLCPEDGLGDAILVLADGRLLKRKATLGEHKLSYDKTIKPHEGHRWEQIELGAGWVEFKVTGEQPRSKFLAQHLCEALFRDAHQVKPRQE